MFLRARFKLTAWYLLIIMLISFLFSLAIYEGLRVEVERSLRLQEFRMYQEALPPGFLINPDKITVDPDLLMEEENRIKAILVLVNLGILIISGGAAYFLAGRTLKPIAKMIDDQNRFITDASHELRTPLTALRSEIEVNLRDKDLTLKDAKKLLKSNLEEVDNLQNLSNNLLTLAQFEKSQKQTTFYFEEISLTKILNASINKLLPLAKNKNITIEKNIENYSISGHESDLIELFVILLDNSIKYSFPKTNIKIGIKKTDDHVLITIKDEGVGISEKDLPHIFERFYRSDISRSKQKVDGYGLGLSIAKKIVDAHNGVISVKSQLEKGTEVTVQLPLIR